MGHYEKFLHWKGDQASEEAAQASGGITIPGTVKKKHVDIVLKNMV